MDYWKGPHSKIISASPGMEEYRQIHLAENNPGLWPAIVTNVPLSFRVTRKVPFLPRFTLHVRVLVSVAQTFPHEP